MPRRPWLSFLLVNPNESRPDHRAAGKFFASIGRMQEGKA